MSIISKKGGALTAVDAVSGFTEGGHSFISCLAHGGPFNLIMQVSISSITIPPHSPGDLQQKLVPTLGLLHPSCCPGGGDLLGSSARGRAFVYKGFLSFFEIFIMMARLGD